MRNQAIRASEQQTPDIWGSVLYRQRCADA
jgi:hypothetical protein